MLQCTKHITVRWKATWFCQLNIVRTMPSPKTYTLALEAAEAPRTSPYTAPNVAPKSAEKAQHLVEQTARTAQSAVQQAGQNLALALQLTGTAVSSYQSVQSKLAEHAQQAVQRTLDALTQASQVRSPTALLDLQSTYLTDSLQAVLTINARLAEIAAEVAQQAADKLQYRAA
jgi:hypothetical protein